TRIPKPAYLLQVSELGDCMAMTTANSSDRFYGSIPVFRGFSSLMDPALYSPLPDDWTIGVADIVESTKAIAEARYKAVNMAGAAVIAAVTNALDGREFPFVFGGDGASFAVSPDDLDRGREGLAAAASWVRDGLDLVMRGALVGVRAALAERLVERSPDAGRPVPPGGPPLRWPPAGMDYEARAARGGSLARRRILVLGSTLFVHVIMRFGIRVGGFVPKTYTRQVVENSDFRKYDDGLRMILDCTVELERALTQRLDAAASQRIIRYGLHRQDAAMMTCFTPSAMRSDHVHFIDGARGGYASAATALKAMVA